ncbi:MAG: bL35 family ribosomal protein [Patescibacteria group bacterium]
MGKLKTKKSILKRFKITKNGKILHRAKGQNHFRGKKTGKAIRKKRKLQMLHSFNSKNIKKYRKI